jgi:hypothetical protein
MTSLAPLCFNSVLFLRSSSIVCGLWDLRIAYPLPVAYALPITYIMFFACHYVLRALSTTFGQCGCGLQQPSLGYSQGKHALFVSLDSGKH